MTDEEMEQELVTYKIEITMFIDQNGEQCWATKYTNNIDGGAIPIIQGLGMLEATKIDLVQQSGMVPMPDKHCGES